MLEREQALQKRDELIDLGYTIVPGVMTDPLLSEVRDWTEYVFDKVEVDPKYRYQGSDVHVSTPGQWSRMNQEASDRHFSDPIVERLYDLPLAKEVCKDLMLESATGSGTAIILSKPPFGPPLYWHQDHMNWNHPESMAPWPLMVFLSYYMTDTNRENGCLRVIPRTMRRRIPLHAILPDAHEAEIQAIEDVNHPVFQDHPDAIDVPVKAGDLVIADSRMLHAAWPNRTDKRRTLVLLWHRCFPFPSIPSWWEGEVPEEFRNPDPPVAVEGTRTPGTYLRG